MRHLLALLLTTSLLQVHAQQASNQAKKLQLTEVGVATGIGPSVFGPFQQYNLEAFLPGSTILADPLKWPGTSFSTGGYDAQLSAWGGFSVKGKKQPVLRLGLTYSAGQPWSQWSSRETRFTFDSLRSTNSNLTYFLDSIVSQQSKIIHLTQHLRLDLALVWHTNNKGAFGFFAGMGSQFGMSVLARTNITFTEIKEEQIRQSHDPSNFRNFTGRSIRSESESFKNGAQWVSSLYLPLGMSIRLGGLGDGLDKSQLFFQAAPTFGLLYGREFGWIANGQLFLQAGLRFSML
jgi:hypothetical protein